MKLSYLLFALSLIALGPLLAIFVKKRKSTLQTSLKYFIFLTVLRLSAVLGYSYYLLQHGENVFGFLITFIAVYSILLIPEVLVIARILDNSA